MPYPEINSQRIFTQIKKAVHPPQGNVKKVGLLPNVGQTYSHSQNLSGPSV